MLISPALSWSFQVLRSSIKPVRLVAKSMKASSFPQGEQISVLLSCLDIAGQLPSSSEHLGQLFIVSILSLLSY